MRIGFIGAGRMAEAIIRGLVSRRGIPKKDICISDKDQNRLKQISKKYKIKACSNKEIVESSNVVILAIKPQSMGAVLTEIASVVSKDQLFISIAAGITVKSLEKYLEKVPVIRVMPNNPALIGEGITAVCRGSFAGEKDMKTAEKIFSFVGDTLRIDEKHMNAVTALSGSGPAFVYEIIDALVNGGVEAGLTKEIATDLALKTVTGSVKTLIKTKKTPQELKEMVTSPGGTTLAGLRVLEEINFKEALKRAVVKAKERAKEISEEFERSL